jgi:hypothetical protein
MFRRIGGGGTQASVAAWPNEAFAEDAGFGRCLIRYLEGWADANPLKILAATASGYRFEDPLVGTFTQRSLPGYFRALQDRFAFKGRMEWGDVACLRAPWQLCLLKRDCNSGGKLQDWLTGVTRIVLSEQGVIAESVAYDLNMACAVLRDPPSSCRNVSGESGRPRSNAPLPPLALGISEDPLLPSSQ